MEGRTHPWDAARAFPLSRLVCFGILRAGSHASASSHCSAAGAFPFKELLGKRPEKTLQSRSAGRDANQSAVTDAFRQRSAGGWQSHG